MLLSVICCCMVSPTADPPNAASITVKSTPPTPARPESNGVATKRTIAKPKSSVQDSDSEQDMGDYTGECYRRQKLVAGTYNFFPAFITEVVESAPYFT